MLEPALAKVDAKPGSRVVNDVGIGFAEVATTDTDDGIFPLVGAQAAKKSTATRVISFFMFMSP